MSISSWSNSQIAVKVFTMNEIFSRTLLSCSLCLFILKVINWKKQKTVSDWQSLICHPHSWPKYWNSEFSRIISVMFLQTRNAHVKTSPPRIISVWKMLLMTELEHTNSTMHPLGTLNTSYVGGNWAWYSQYESYRSAIDNHLYVKLLLLYTKGTF